jgi:hypothetical protein
LPKRRSRAGRPRKAGKRTPSGRLAAVRDPGTPDLARHKRALRNGSDLALSTNVVDVLFARGHLDARQHRAAIRFRQARDAMVRRLTIGQKLALLDLVLDVWPRWLRRQIAGVPLVGADLAEHRDLLGGLDAVAASSPAEGR